MAETLKTWADVIASLADNETGEIGAQDIKDALFSTQQCWAGMAKRSTGDQAISGGTTAKITMNSGIEGLAMQSAFSDANDRLTVPTNGAGSYMVHYGCALGRAGPGTTDFDLWIYKNGVRTIATSVEPKGVATPDWISLAGVGIYSSTIDADFFELWGNSASGGVLVNEAYLHIQRIG